ncbi:MAG: D-tyrosyl-tRNA(Tyr) deacylase [Candidatus Obscuribacter sp.]|jgi:D-tyrosyl-tRNA(Tyr) deacylase|nr:D-tyrosyl-tRNA(Tyr) deacylase [Candidatus Obscuribacter sp.]MBL0184896.1 D-tyrosyl-tRNA(Tyr) deacylase [Candidatus Obscuribacter sp.]MBP6348834.1 D-tyrosyl-tRNA(Tyr) deacylase [Candidatus Obscuribacter sp.]MBP6592544.1 D-tyrosyl-tRNA(Tyr) deacylase [Candidatus Obscuribacter sp.]MBP7576733.1 D-tyrosyl-tRNA(Tyr) deacylase [Candidatus Obscuribacter sp.]
MKAVLQRASRASVTVNGEVVSEFASQDGKACGLLILLGVEQGDSEADSAYLATKAVELRIFSDSDDKFNLSVQDAGSNIIVVSQFTLLADWKKGRRPGFTKAAAPEIGQKLYLHFVEELKKKGLNVGTGVFGAHMEVSLVNSGPVTMLLESRDGKPV